MRQGTLRPILILLVALTLAACAQRGQITLSESAPEGATVHSIFVATSRVPTTGPTRFGSKRAEALRHALYDISVPPNHEKGQIEWPRGNRVDPDFAFVTTSEMALTGPDFTRRLDRHLDGLAPSSREVVVFVHGFNNTYAEGLYRLAQITHDFEIPGAAVSYAWPSAGNPLGYVYDRDSTVTARDGLEQLLHQVAETRTDRILIVAHSMGSFLTMEALRQAAIRDRASPLWRKISGVVLLSPDIDVDVFRSQARAIGVLPQPFFIFTSRRDRALMLSAGLTGRVTRLGSLDDLDALADLNVTVVDTTQVRGGDGLGHFTTATSPAAIAVLGNLRAYQLALNADQAGAANVLPGSVRLFRNVTQVVLNPLGL
ncbi:alpha/beta hydrolase [Maritimibacter sp. 55A14]|uniref:alpha/beta hydrolase n=1 Tax=Maritimibacter sp. 55A14 TaxID=2174844 RepID=UPI001304F184|nr:alpha/beta fold hydrolase [Maritimibacter sp. 55A14]